MVERDELDVDCAQKGTLSLVHARERGRVRPHAPRTSLTYASKKLSLPGLPLAS